MEWRASCSRRAGRSLPDELKKHRQAGQAAGSLGYPLELPVAVCI